MGKEERGWTDWLFRRFYIGARVDKQNTEQNIWKQAHMNVNIWCTVKITP